MNNDVWPPPPPEQSTPLPSSASLPVIEQSALGLSLLGSFLLIIGLYFLELRPNPLQGMAGVERSEADEQVAVLLGLSSLLPLLLGLIIGASTHKSWAGRGAVVLSVATVVLAVAAVVAGLYHSYP